MGRGKYSELHFLKETPVYYDKESESYYLLCGVYSDSLKINRSFSNIRFLERCLVQIKSDLLNSSYTAVEILIRCLIGDYYNQNITLDKYKFKIIKSNSKKDHNKYYDVIDNLKPVEVDKAFHVNKILEIYYSHKKNLIRNDFYIRHIDADDSAIRSFYKNEIFRNVDSERTVIRLFKYIEYTYRICNTLTKNRSIDLFDIEKISFYKEILRDNSLYSMYNENEDISYSDKIQSIFKKRIIKNLFKEMNIKNVDNMLDKEYDLIAILNFIQKYKQCCNKSEIVENFVNNVCNFLNNCENDVYYRGNNGLPLPDYCDIEKYYKYGDINFLRYMTVLTIEKIATKIKEGEFSKKLISQLVDSKILYLFDDEYNKKAIELLESIYYTQFIPSLDSNTLTKPDFNRLENYHNIYYFKNKDNCIRFIEDHVIRKAVFKNQMTGRRTVLSNLYNYFVERNLGGFL